MKIIHRLSKKAAAFNERNPHLPQVSQQSESKEKHTKRTRFVRMSATDPIEESKSKIQGGPPKRSVPLRSDSAKSPKVPPKLSASANLPNSPIPPPIVPPRSISPPPQRSLPIPAQSNQSAVADPLRRNQYVQLPKRTNSSNAIHDAASAKAGNARGIELRASASNVNSPPIVPPKIDMMRQSGPVSVGPPAPTGSNGPSGFSAIAFGSPPGSSIGPGDSKFADLLDPTQTFLRDDGLFTAAR
jgi:hypothetical protein